jgi:3D-(3,5/4)-trihydroxycyclohexane-1,2-dione acylhydrolase (decyclizing)
MTETQSIRRSEREARAACLARAGGLDGALQSGSLPRRIDTTLSEALVLGLLSQGVRTFFCVLGHGSTEIGEVLRIYHQAGLLRACGVRSEIEASHAASALRWVAGERAAVVTSIGPGALQALAASLVPASNGLGVWYLLGDETTQDEGPNMQQLAGDEQNAFLRLFGTAGKAYSLHTPGALSTALRRGRNTVDHPYAAGPFFLLLPLNTQSSALPSFHLDELDCALPPAPGAAADAGSYERAAAALERAERVVVKVGGGARAAGSELVEFLELADAVAVTSPVVSGVLPYAHERNMGVGGSKGSLCGNYAMEHADLLVSVGSRSVCQADCSRTGYPQVTQVININADAGAALHYSRAIPLVGDAAATLRRLNVELERLRHNIQRAPSERGISEGAPVTNGPSPWRQACCEHKLEWERLKQARYACATLQDEIWGGEVLTQPAAIKVISDWARDQRAVCFYDAGDVQANGFQIVEDERLGQSYTDTGASYMGFAASALLATAVAREPFYGVAVSGDGSFTMSPQILIDGVEHGATGCLIILDNRRMGAISGLQRAQYGVDYATRDSVAIDYISWARSIAGVQGLDGGRSTATLRDALERAWAYHGLSLIHVPVYFGDDELGGMGVFGRWNVGNWCSATQALRHEIGL